MSSRLFSQDIRFSQMLLSSCGLYHGSIDGNFGPMMKAAEDAFDVLTNSYRQQYGTFDNRSEGNIATLLPKMQVATRKLMVLARNRFTVGQVQILSGTRTYAEQNMLYNQRPKVTNAKGGSSNHNFGIAVDVGIFVRGVYYTGRNSIENKAYKDFSVLVKSELGAVGGKEKLLEWGGDWKSIVDMPHYQLYTGKSTSQVRALLEAGKSYA